MKKIILLLIAIFVLSVLFSCGDETQKTPDESSNETVSGDVAETEGENKEEQPKRLSEEEKSKLYKVVEFDLPEGNFTNLYKLALRNKFLSVFEGLTDGEYTLILTAGISRGNAELARVDFTHSK